MKDENERKVCLKWWQIPGIHGAMQKGFVRLPNPDTIKKIDPVTETGFDLQSRATSIAMIKEPSKYVSNEPNSCNSHSDGEVKDNE